MKIKVGIVDDHQLFRTLLGLLLNSFLNTEVILTAANGKDMQGKLEILKTPPDVMLVDVEMPLMNGIEASRWLKEKYPDTKPIALTMNAQEETILSMIKAGCCSYLLKDTCPDELEHALREVYKHRYYNSEIPDGNLGHFLVSKGGDYAEITDKELEFLHYATSDQPYKQIAIQMNVTERTIDGYREAMFLRFGVQSRTGMVLEALRRGLVRV